MAPKEVVAHERILIPNHEKFSTGLNLAGSSGAKGGSSMEGVQAFQTREILMNHKFECPKVCDKLHQLLSEKSHHSNGRSSERWQSLSL